ncbi:MAG: T9SS type A sorting domain-containing protein, partial [Saprospiraceae bacterium]
IIFSHGHGAFKCELPDPIVVSNKELNNSIDINYSTLNKYIILTNPNLVIPHIRAIDLQGKQHILWNQQNKFHTNELKSGIYLIQIEPKSKSAKKIFIIN